MHGLLGCRTSPSERCCGAEHRGAAIPRRRLVPRCENQGINMTGRPKMGTAWIESKKHKTLIYIYIYTMDLHLTSFNHQPLERDKPDVFVKAIGDFQLSSGSAAARGLRSFTGDSLHRQETSSRGKSR